MSKPISFTKRLKALEKAFPKVSRIEINKEFGKNTWIWEADLELENPELVVSRNWVRAEVFTAWIDAELPWDKEKGDYELSVITAPGMVRLVYVGLKKVEVSGDTE